MSKVNYFIEPIVMKKKKHDFKAWLLYRKVIRHCKKTSPSFDEMCRIAEFIRLIRESYMYSNTLDFHLYLGTYPKGYTRLNCYSMIYSEASFSIAFVLLTDTREINIEITRSGQSIKSEKETISFIDGQYQFKNIYDQEKFLFIVSCLMSGVRDLITYYYKNKRF